MFNFFLFLVFASVLPCANAQTSITGEQIRNPLRPVAALPAICRPYNVYFLTSTNTPYICTAPNTFTPFATGSSSGIPSQTGTPGYLYSNGTTLAWGQMLTGGSGALDCVSTPGQCDVTSIVPLKGSMNVWTGANDFRSGLLRLPETTIAGLPPAANNTGREFMVTDGASTCDTTAGGGKTRVFVESDGMTYVAPNCSSDGVSTGNGGGPAPSTYQQIWINGAPSSGSSVYSTLATGPIYYTFTLLVPTSIKHIFLSGAGGYDASNPYVAVAWYNDSCNLIAGSVSAIPLNSSQGAVGFIFPYSSALTLAAGTYFLAISYSGTGVSNVFEATDNYTSYGLAHLGSPPTFTGSNAASWSGSTPVFPSTCGTKTGQNGASYGMPFPLLLSN